MFRTLSVLVCMLTGLRDIIWLASWSWACILLHLSFHLLHLLCFVFIKLHRPAFVVAWLIYGFAGYLVTYLQWTGGLVGWLPIWLTGNAGAVLHHVANRRLLSLRLV